MKKLEIIVRHSKADKVKDALLEHGIHGMTLSDVQGFGRQGGHTETYRGTDIVVEFVPKVKFEVVLEQGNVAATVEAVRAVACTGKVGDGKIFVMPVEEVMRIRTGESGREAL